MSSVLSALCLMFGSKVFRLQERLWSEMLRQQPGLLKSIGLSQFFVTPFLSLFQFLSSISIILFCPPTPRLKLE